MPEAWDRRMDRLRGTGVNIIFIFVRNQRTNMKILMVCLGNICRSPMAEGILRRKIAENDLDWKVDSAGTERDHIGEPPHPFSLKVARRHGIDISGQRARRFVPGDLEKFDKIYAMAPDVIREMQHLAGQQTPLEKVDLLLNEPYPGQDLPVPDPWYGGEDGFEKAYDLIEEACDRIIEKYGVKAEAKR